MNVIIDGVIYVPATAVVTDKNLLAALEVRFNSNAGDNLTVRDYLQKLLEKLWEEGQSFSGKRPFGDIDWRDDLYAPLVKKGFIEGTFDDDGCLKDLDEMAARRYVEMLIIATFRGVESPNDQI